MYPIRTAAVLWTLMVSHTRESLAGDGHVFWTDPGGMSSAACVTQMLCCSARVASSCAGGPHSKNFALRAYKEGACARQAVRS